MRASDQREILAIRPHDSLMQLAWESYHLIRYQGRGRIAWHKGRPAALAAFTENWPGHWNVWMFGTNDFKPAAVELIRWIRRELPLIIRDCNGRRLEADSIEGHHEAHAMMKALGAREEVPMRCFGKGGETFIKFVWIHGENDSFIKPHYVAKENIMCFGGKSKSTAAPAAQPATTFAPVVADGSRDQQQRAAVLSSSTQPATMGSDLSTGTGTLGGSAPAMPAAR